jgi:hypothetical protein
VEPSRNRIHGSEGFLATKVAEVLWQTLVGAGIKRSYGIVGDAVRRNGQIELIHVRNEKYGVFAGVEVERRAPLVYPTLNNNVALL